MRDERGKGNVSRDTCGTDIVDEWRLKQNDYCAQREDGVLCEDARIPDVLHAQIRMLG